MHKIKKSSTLPAVIVLLLTVTGCTENCIKADRCNLEPDAGPCEALIPKYYYDKEDKKCKQFNWGGCDGIIPFETLEECKKQCDCE